MRLVNAVWGIAYATRGQYSHPWHLANYICAGVEDHVSFSSDVISFLENRLEEIRKTADREPVTNEIALAYLVANDVERLIATARNRVSDSDLNEGDFERIFEKVRSSFASHGLEVGEAAVRVCEVFPEPYQSSRGWAMSYDISDHRKYDIRPGVVLNRMYLMPLYTTALIAHELTHTALGQVDSNYLARGLEEGLAELFGTLCVGGELLGNDVAEAIMINSRLRYPQDDHFGRMYAENVRQAAVLALQSEWTDIVDLLRRGNKDGRGVIKDAERALLRQDLCWSSHVKNRSVTPGRVGTFAEKFLSFPQSLVVSPLSMYLAERIRDDMRVKELMDDSHVLPDAGEVALQELQNRVKLIVIFNGRVTANETKAFFESNTLRYEPKL